VRVGEEILLAKVADRQGIHVAAEHPAVSAIGLGPHKAHLGDSGVADRWSGHRGGPMATEKTQPGCG